MATNNKQTAQADRKTVRRSLVETPVSSEVPADPRQAEQLAKVVSDDLVMVNVPRAFTLTLDDGTPVPIRAGVQNMPESLASHWYSKQWGVGPFDPNAA